MLAVKRYHRLLISLLVGSKTGEISVEIAELLHLVLQNSRVGAAAHSSMVGSIEGTTRSQTSDMTPALHTFDF